MRDLAVFFLVATVFLGSACSQPDVVIYSALDQVHSEPLIRAFEEETGLTVKANYDLEAVKTVGLVNTLIEEANRPKCDVFWNNELVHTIRLKNKGLLQPYRSKNAEDIPDKWKDPEEYWTGFAARARVFILNEELAREIEPDEAKWPKTTRDLFDPKWKGQAGMAKPLAGTTLTHMSVLWSFKGEEWVQSFWEKHREREGRITTGNAHLMKEVVAGQFVFGYTDTDDYRKAEIDGAPVRRIFPDQDLTGEIPGCLVIPNSVAMIANCPHPENAKRLIDFILRKETEEALARGPSAQMPVRKSVPRPDYVRSAEELVTLTVDWEKVADAVEPTRRWLTRFLAGDD